MQNIIRSLLLLILLVAATSCQSIDPNNPPMTLATNPNAPNDVIQEFYSASRWNQIKNLKYDAFVVLRGVIADNRTIPNPRITKSFPDNQRDAMALDFARDIRISPVTIGGRIRGSAEVHVYFYETTRRPRQALVVAKQQSTTGPTASLGGTTYLLTVTY